MATSENPEIKACDRTESDVGAEMIVCPKGRTHRFARTLTEAGNCGLFVFKYVKNGNQLCDRQQRLDILCQIQ